MKLVTTTADLVGCFESKSIAAPLEAIGNTPFTHIDLSMYNVIYDGSPWIGQGEEWKKEIDDCQKIAQKCGFDFCQSHAPSGTRFKGEEDRKVALLAIRRAIEGCAMLGIPHTVVHAEALSNSRWAKWFGREKFDRLNREFFAELGEATEKYGVDILVENSSDLWNRGYLLNSGAEIRKFVKNAGIPRLHVCWDTGHANCNGADQYEEIVTIGDELRAFHMHDNYGSGDSHIMPMMGTINWDQVMRAIKKIGYKGDFTFECDSTVRGANSWPHYRNNVQKEDLLSEPPLVVLQKQIAATYEVGKWMLSTYGYAAE